VSEQEQFDSCSSFSLAATAGAFVAPNASVAAPEAVRLLLHVAAFGPAAAALVALGRAGLGQAFALVVVANAGVMLALGQ
jgi:hypothetical protein